jgi:cell division protein ZapA (FtsZ GTPase activity inhibitor)
VRECSIEAGALIGPRINPQVHRQAITKLIDDAMDAFACRNDGQLRQALSMAYSIWTTHELTERVKSTSCATKL